MNDYKIALLCNAYSTNSECFTLPMGALVETIYGNGIMRVPLPGTSCLASGSITPLPMNLLDSLTVHAKMRYVLFIWFCIKCIDLFLYLCVCVLWSGTFSKNNQIFYYNDIIYYRILEYTNKPKESNCYNLSIRNKHCKHFCRYSESFILCINICLWIFFFNKMGSYYTTVL